MDAKAFRHRVCANFNRLLNRVGAPAPGLGRVKYVAEAFGISNSAAGKWLTGASSPDPARFDEILEFFQASYLELLGDWSAQKGNVCLPQVNEPSGLGSFLADMSGKPDHRHVCIIPPIAQDYPLPNTVYALQIDSNTMEPYVVRGDWVLFSPVRNLDQDGCYVLSIRGRTTVRRLQILASGRLKLIPENIRYPSEDVAASDVYIVGASGPADAAIGVLGFVVARFLNGH